MPELPPIQQQIKNLKRIDPSLTDNEARGLLKTGEGKTLPSDPNHALRKDYLMHFKLLPVEDYGFEKQHFPGMYTAYAVPCQGCGKVRWLQKSDAKKALRGSNLCRSCSSRKTIKKINAKKKGKK